MRALLRKWLAQRKLRNQAAHLELTLRQADGRFDLESPTLSELEDYEADKALLAKIRAELAQ